MNIVILKGNITKDIDLRFAKNKDMAIAKFGIAVARMKKDDPADFFNVTAFGKQAETIAERLGKGDPILIKGHLQTGSYDHKDGYKVYTTDVMLESFEFIGGKKEKTTKNTASDDFEPVEDDQDIPF